MLLRILTLVCCYQGWSALAADAASLAPPAPAAAAAPSTSAPAAVQQQPPQASPTLAPSIYLMGVPGVQQCPAPDWIKPGMRLVFLSASATVASNPNDVGLVEDPNGPIEDSSGKRWRETGFVAGGAGGAGYTIVDIVAVEPNGVVMEVSSFLLVNGTQGPASLVSSTGFACHPSGCDWFLHPRMLAQVPNVSQGGVSVMRHSYPLNNQTFNALRFTVVNQGRSTSVYDLTSGVLLSSNSSIVAPTGTASSGGYIVTTSGNSMGINRFIAASDKNLPWQNGHMPDWARTAKRLRYSGAMTTRAPAHLQTPDFRVGLTVDMRTSYVGQNCSVYATTTHKQQVSDMPGAADPVTGVAVCGPGSTGGVWMDPAILRTLRAGQAIFADSTLGSQTVVEFTGRDSTGRAVVSLTTTSPAHRMQSVYDLNDGRLLSMSRQDAPGESGFSTIYELQLTGVE